MTNETANKLIEATQNAVLNAADSVVNAIEISTHDIESHHEVFYQSAEFWVAASFVLVVLLLFYPISRITKIMLYKRARKIGKRIEDATILKEDAQKLLAEYERKYRRAKQEAQEIITRAEKEINFLKKESLNKMETAMAAKEKEVKERIKSSRANALKEISQITTAKTIKTTKQILMQKIDSVAQDKLIDESIKSIENSNL
ncbi:MAG: F0F1 ATP synthase subunit B [Alphaproteobacteria bacterium]|nr:F0F1 ATP synthase subunit B [Alphaproteobacteria bacterium]